MSGLGGGSMVSADVHVFDQLGSTSAWLRSERASLDSRLAAGHSQICVTDWQQAGVGRRGKVWQTQPGNITFSVLTRVEAPAQALLGLSLVTGIAVAEALEDALGIAVKLKWPNDVILNNGKLGGLLTEIVTNTPHARAGEFDSAEAQKDVSALSVSTDVITGIGVNVNHDDAVLGMGIGATSLNQLGIELARDHRDKLIGQVAASVLALHERFVMHGWGPFRQSWGDRDWLAGKQVSIHHDDATEHARACGVNEQGALLVENAGKLTPLYGGNISIRPTV